VVLTICAKLVCLTAKVYVLYNRIKNTELWNLTTVRSVQDVPLYNLITTDVASNIMGCGGNFLGGVGGDGISFYRDVIIE
jgi:hypothetical protein